MTPHPYGPFRVGRRRPTPLPWVLSTTPHWNWTALRARQWRYDNIILFLRGISILSLCLFFMAEFMVESEIVFDSTP